MKVEEFVNLELSAKYYRCLEIGVSGI